MKPRIAKTTLGLIVGLGILVCVAALAYRHLSSLSETRRWVSHTHQVLETSQAMTIAIADATSARRAFALTGNESALRPYRSAVSSAASAGAALRRLTADNPAQQKRLDQLEPVVAARLAQLDEAIRAARALGFSAERELSLTRAGDSLTARLRSIVGEMETEERQLLGEREAAALAGSTAVKRTIAVGFTAAIVILFLAFLHSRREVFRRVRSEAALAERERHLAIILSSIGDGVIATDAAGAITHLNPVAEQITGWPTAEATGKPFADVFRIISEETRAPEPDPVARVLAEQIKIGLANHTALIARDGVERPIADSASPILDEQGNLRGVVIVFRDVTETKAVEERFRRLVDAAPDAIVIADADGRISIVNDQATSLFGYSRAELIGQPVETLLPEGLRERHAENRRRYHAAPTVRSMGTGLKLFAKRKDGTVCPVEVALSPLHTPEGMQVIAAVRDVTRRRELERFRDEYVGYISHDLKNPLSIISLHARMLAQMLAGRVSPDEMRAVKVIGDSAAFIDRLVRELLEMAYVESDHIEIRPEPVELATFLESVLERTVSSSDRARVRLEVVESSTVAAERSRLERVVVNFIQNALKYSPASSPILVRLEAIDNCAVISVIDRGPGIAPEDRSYVFEKYKRTDSARSQEGLGLGLYISRKIIEAHQGEIGVGGAAGEGAAFFVRLPRIADVPAIAGTDRAAVTTAANRLRGLKVLLVDDEVHAISALTVLLGEEGFVVAGATSGEEALARAASERPEVAVLDVQMPGMSGLTLLERLREQQPGLPAVIMSGHMEQHASIAEARRKGDVSYVGKPVNVDELLRTIDQLFLTRPA